jgi:hypothetical protein
MDGYIMEDASSKKNIVVVPEGQKAFLIEEFSNIYGTQHKVIPLEESELDKKKRLDSVIG